MTMELAKWSRNLGSRDLGEQVRLELLNTINTLDKPIELSFKDVLMVSSSFADECFGKLILTIGSKSFREDFLIKDLDDQVIKMVLNRSIKQRLIQAN